jgi:hypothetical protein
MVGQPWRFWLALYCYSLAVASRIISFLGGEESTNRVVSLIFFFDILFHAKNRESCPDLVCSDLGQKQDIDFSANSGMSSFCVRVDWEFYLLHYPHLTITLQKYSHMSLK